MANVINSPYGSFQQRQTHQLKQGRDKEFIINLFPTMPPQPCDTDTRSQPVDIHKRIELTNFPLEKTHTAAVSGSARPLMFWCSESDGQHWPDQEGPEGPDPGTIPSPRRKPSSVTIVQCPLPLISQSPLLLRPSHWNRSSRIVLCSVYAICNLYSIQSIIRIFVRVCFQANLYIIWSTINFCQYMKHAKKNWRYHSPQDSEAIIQQPRWKTVVLLLKQAGD